MTIPRLGFLGIVALAACVSGGPGVAGETRTAVTFNKDIAPLVFERCAGCHRPGEVAPFSLLGYGDVRKRAELIRTVTHERTMPPWKAEPGALHFADERRLSDDQVALIDRWVQSGTPEGDPADLPPAPRFTPGWQLGEPDMVLNMSEPYALADQGPDVYRCFVIPLEVPAGKYLAAVEFRPGNRRIVHHAVLASLPHKAAQAKLAAGDGKSFGSGLAPPGQLLPGPLAFWTPGMVPRPLPDGLAAAWSNGSDLILQLHLHPSGKPETEQSQIGLHFTDQKPRGRLRLMVLNNERIDIPPGETDHAVKVSTTLRDALDVHGVFPHMHLIGRTVKVTATLPDGKVQPLIAIGDWNFNWQHYYQYTTPVRLPAGTKVEGHFTYDNSGANPANPNKPPQRVTYGEQTANEMAIVIFDVLPAGPSAPRPRLSAADVMRRGDKDGDGKLSLDEVVAALGDRVPREELEKRLAQFDRNQDKYVDLMELTEALQPPARP
jgi:hypothetical protein